MFRQTRKIWSCGIAALLLTALPLTAAPSKKTEVNLLEVPYLSTYYVEPVVTPQENVKIKYYVTDWNQSEYRLMDFSHRFNLKLEYGLENAKKLKAVTKKNLPAGDHEFDLGKLAPGIYRLALSAEDSFGRRSPVLFHEFWVRDPVKSKITERETYNMKEADLKRYGISNRGDYGIFEVMEAGNLSRYDLEAFTAERARLAKFPDDKYLVIIGALKYPDCVPTRPNKKIDPATDAKNAARDAARGAHGCPQPEYLPNLGGCKSRALIYGKKYDHKKVEDEAVLTGTGLNLMMAELAKKGVRKLVLLPGTYRISNKTTLEVPREFTLDLNGATIKLNQFAGCGGMMIRIRDGFDTHVVNGIVEGDYFEHDYEASEKNSEWVCGVSMDGDTRYSSYERLLVRYITGYGVTHGFHGTFGGTAGLSGFARGTINRKTGKWDDSVEGLAVSGFTNIKSLADAGNYLTVSLILGYQGLGAGGWNLIYHFYDKNQRYLESVDGWHYRRVRIPPKAEFLRTTIYADKPPKETGLAANAFKVPWNSWYKDLFITNARCVGMAPAAMYNFKVENCTFTRSGESGAFCAFDAEDGWDMMQDVWLVRNKFFTNGRNDLLTCAGHNFIMEDNEGQIYLWPRTKSYVVRGNKITSGTFGSEGRNRTLLPRIDNNTYSYGARLGGDGKDWYIVMTDAANAPSITCGQTGMLVGISLKNIQTQRVNMLAGELIDSDMPFAGATFIKSKLFAVRGHTNGTVKIDGCEMKDITSGIFKDGDVRITDTTLTDVQYNFAYWTKPGKVTFVNCVIRNKDKPLVTSPAYSVGEFRFVNCDIDTGNAPALKIYDQRAQPTDKESGSVVFENCTITNTSGLVVEHANKDNKKPLVFKGIKCLFEGRFMDTGKLPASWKAENTPGKGRIVPKKIKK